MEHPGLLLDPGWNAPSVPPYQLARFHASISPLSWAFPSFDVQGHHLISLFYPQIYTEPAQLYPRMVADPNELK